MCTTIRLQSHTVAVAALFAALVAFPTVVSAQQGLCARTSSAPPLFGQDACFKAQSILAFVAPQLGVAASGGNSLPGEGGALGGWGKRSALFRVLTVAGQLPNADIPLDRPGIPVRDNLGAAPATIVVPSLDVAVGLYRGVPVGLTNVGGVDLLLGVTGIANLNRGPMSVARTNAAFVTNVGVRVGLLQESALVPGVAISVMRRRLPDVNLSYITGNDTAQSLRASVASTAVRLTANKRFGFLALGGGVGHDRFRTAATLDAVVNGEVDRQSVRAVLFAENQTSTSSRGTAFLSAAVGLPKAQLVFELGYSRAGEAITTSSSFGDRRVNEGYRYGSAGFGFRF